VSTTPPASAPRRRILLFVAGDEPNSRIALANVEKLRSGANRTEIEIEVIDVLTEGSRALEHNVLVTPTLIQLQPGRVVVIGNLSALDRVRTTLGLEAR
jgi:circadian clock protein KaiB